LTACRHRPLLGKERLGVLLRRGDVDDGPVDVFHVFAQCVDQSPSFCAAMGLLVDQFEMPAFTPFARSCAMSVAPVGIIGMVEAPGTSRLRAQAERDPSRG
jgi:hypothetical protein